MKTKRILLQLSILLTITFQALAQAPQHYAAKYPGKAITDTAALKNELRRQYLQDTNMRLQFIMSHDTLYLLILHADMQTRGTKYSGLIRASRSCLGIAGETFSTSGTMIKQFCSLNQRISVSFSDCEHKPINSRWLSNGSPKVTIEMQVNVSFYCLT